MTHRANTTNTTVPVTPGGWVRLALYVVAVVAGLAAILAEPLGFGGLTELLVSISGLLLVATGGTAALNLGKADDQRLNIRELIPAVRDVAGEVRDLRERQPDEVADKVAERVNPAPAPAPEPDFEVQPEPAGKSLLEALQKQIAQNRIG